MSDELTEREQTELRAAFARHGYGFQYASVKEFIRLREARQSRWWVDATEFPVEVNSAQLHVDIILRTTHGLMVVECKRVNPGLGTWCFGRTAFTAESSSEQNGVRFESAVRTDPAAAFAVWRGAPEHSDHQYHVALEMKSGQGDAQGSGRGALNEGVTQALRGASGIINTLIGRPSLFRGLSLKVIPVVLTTARVVTCNGDLAESSLETGHLLASLSFSERPWVWFRVNAPAQLRHGAEIRRNERNGMPVEHFRTLADEEFARSVGVVSVSGLQDFLNAANFHVGEY